MSVTFDVRDWRPLTEELITSTERRMMHGPPAEIAIQGRTVFGKVPVERLELPDEYRTEDGDVVMVSEPMDMKFIDRIEVPASLLERP